MVIEYGDVPSWVEALGTIGAFIIALGLLYQSLQDKKMGQAKLITAWQVELQPFSMPDASIIYDVLNNSGEPAYNVTFGAMCGVRGSFVRHIGVIGPKERRRITIYLPGSPRANQYSPDLIFTDASGLTWYRNSMGKIKQVSADEIGKLIQEDAGAYASLSEHPTLRKHPEGQPEEGVRHYDKNL